MQPTWPRSGSSKRWVALQERNPLLEKNGGLRAGTVQRGDDVDEPMNLYIDNII